MSKLAKLFHPATIISTCFWVGKIPFMPGTFGSIAGALFVLFIFFQPHLREINGEYVVDYASGIIAKELIFPFLIGSTIVVSIIGIWAGEVYEKIAGKKDPSEVVIDEVAGIMVAYSCVIGIYALLLQWKPIEFGEILRVGTLLMAVVVLVLFRIFDILKPWHVRWGQDNFKGGLGIMLDDLIAGVYTAITFTALLFIARYFDLFGMYADWLYSDV
jgi:phosphatidylglycerophosphatase A